MKKFKPKAQPGKRQQVEHAPNPGVDVNDHIYVNHRGQPCTGVVRAHGKHGATVEIDGAHHPVKWEDYLGHKKRAQQRYDVLDQGEDGMLVQDGQGRRRFVGIPNESKEDPMVAKAFGGRPVLLLKAAPPTGGQPGPGLSKKVITDKNGVQTSRWVSTGAGGPPAQPGQHVGFENGEHRGHGEVTAAGQHGVTVRDQAGGEHRVHHEKVTHHWEGEGAPDKSPHEQPADAAAGAKDAGALFAPGEVDKLPAKVNQPAKSWDELVEKGAEGLAQFQGMLGKVQQAMGLKSGMKPEAVTPEQWENDDGFLFVAPLKGAKRAAEKVEADYGGDWSQLRDIVRATISVPTMGHVKQALEHMKAAGIEIAMKPKNRFEKPTPEGYRDLMAFVKLPNGMVAELQIHTKAMTLAKEKGHKDYEITRTLQGKYGEGAPSDKWDDADHTAFYDAVKRQKQVYDEAWAKSTGAQDKPLIKSDQSATLQVLFWKVSK